MALNEKTRAWTNTDEGKEIQRMIFKFLFDWRKSQFKYGDGKYEWMGRGWIEGKMKQQHPGLNHEKFIYSLLRLEEHKYIIAQQLKGGEHIKLTKKGWERWEKTNV